MEKIKLSKDAKALLRTIASNKCQQLSKEENGACLILEQEGLIQATKLIDGSIACPRLTNKGETYIYENPKLKNPSIFDDTKYCITTAISIIAIILSIIALIK